MHYLERKGWQVNADGRWFKRMTGVVTPLKTDDAIRKQLETEFYGEGWPAKGEAGREQRNYKEWE